ncbi:hypothetical protein Q4506_12970 [Colwellia sp. 4_MG-2023]|jgi:hypothetical protein|uniref:hypothetical protein n=1 Tax=unclassified Colwellia TaxID=196834 RepID=UPI001C0910AD|nr:MULTISPECIES: hypothetical protein [unclassified Colwellia]MBU2925306.1 hypothetical protein [Colwellia sp. C2M11]MDO6486778.1 hypothetical protein [Colwellia sp. 6_MG-2023]MDO6506964.1 hypothetical protein [Colwellia sp. 5_MG-2023]MDO6556598.1 hypothetical protein [Colwellia sp. 4_MG-2023]MDO6651169.1 hypothetical protein [Colwellia sp. 3_MG-2023]
MPNKLKTRLENIVEISRQALLQLEIQVKNTITSNDENILTDNLSINEVQYQLNSEQLLNLLAKRQALISQLFENYTQKQLSVELTMINEMITLDQKLTSLSQKNKQALATQVTKLKKSSKVRDLYNKY